MKESISLLLTLLCIIVCALCFVFVLWKILYGIETDMRKRECLAFGKNTGHEVIYDYGCYVKSNKSGKWYYDEYLTGYKTDE